MKTRILLMSAAIVAGILVAGCSKDKDDEKATGSTATEQPGGGGNTGGGENPGGGGVNPGGGETPGGFTTEGYNKNAYFSVSTDRHVYISKGNLQYQASTNTWRFAEHQYDYIGAANSNISATYDGWIDLFGWGTSGWNSGANAYLPYSTSTDFADYWVGGAAYYCLTGDYAHADWGVHNAIQNGGNQAGIWRTLTHAELTHLIYGRQSSTVNGVANAHFAMAKVCGVNGMILFPDRYTHPSDVAQPVNVNTANHFQYAENTYDDKDWQEMEAAGCIFLPAAESRVGTTVNAYLEENDHGYYYTSDFFCENGAVTLMFNEGYLSIANLYGRHEGRSVRLVIDEATSQK